MEQREEQLAHLGRLAAELAGRGFTARLDGDEAQPYLEVANRDSPELHERVICHPARDGSWCYWWPWQQPIGGVADLPTVSRKITAVLRSVEGQA